MAGIRSSFVLLTILGTQAVGSSGAAAGPIGPREGVTVIADQAAPQTPADKAVRQRAEELAREASDRFTEIMNEKNAAGGPGGSGNAQGSGEDRALAPVWDWLARASKNYQDVIIAKLKNPASDVAVQTGPTTLAAAPAAPAAKADEAAEPQMQLGWTSIMESVREWLAHANRSYRNEIVKKLARPLETKTPEAAVAAAEPPPTTVPQLEETAQPETAVQPETTAPPPEAPAQPEASAKAGSSAMVAIPERKAKAVSEAKQVADAKAAEAAAQAKREAEAAAEAKREAEAAAEAKRQAEAAAEAKRQAEAAAQAKRQAEAAAEAKRAAEAAAEAKRKAEAAAEAKRQAEAADAKRKAEAAAEAERKADAAAEAKRMAEAAAESKRQAEAAAEAKRAAEAAVEADRRAKATAEETRLAQADTGSGKPQPVAPPVRKEATGAAAPKAREEPSIPEVPPRAERKRERAAVARQGEAHKYKRGYKRHRRHAHATPRYRRWAHSETRRYKKAVRGWGRKCRRCGRGHRRHGGGGHIYVVRRGDTLSGIARRYYGNGRRYRTIYRANRGRIRNPHLIYPRQRIYIP